MPSEVVPKFAINAILGHHSRNRHISQSTNIEPETPIIVLPINTINADVSKHTCFQLIGPFQKHIPFFHASPSVKITTT